MSPRGNHHPCSVRGCWSPGSFGLCDKHASERAVPSVSAEDARRSPGARRMRDEQLGRRCGLAEDELPGFVYELGLFDLRTEALEEQRALQEAEVARARRQVIERVDVRAPRIFAPGHSAPRAA